MQSPIFKSFVAGSLSGTCSTVLLQPLDLVKTRIQSPATLEHSHRGILYTISNVVRHEKILGLWRGVIPVSINITVLSLMPRDKRPLDMTFNNWARYIVLID